MTSSPKPDVPDRWTLLARPDDRPNLIRAVLSVPVLLLPAATGLPGGWRGLGYGVVWFLLSGTNFLLHQHVYRPFARSPAVSRAVDWLLSCTTGTSACNWPQQHLLRLHRRDDSWGRAFDWEFCRPTSSGRSPTDCGGADRLRPPALGGLRPRRAPERTGADPLPGRVRRAGRRRRVRRDADRPRAGVLRAVLLPRPVLHPDRGLPDPRRLRPECVRVREQHSFPAYNRVRNNFGFHTAHHLFPEAPWSELPSLHAGIVGRIPA